MQLHDLAGQPVAIYPGFKVLGAGLTGTSLLSQAVYWTERTKDGWFYKSREEWEEETSLSRCEQELARKKLIAIGVLQETRKGIPCRLHYRVDTDTLKSILSDESLQSVAQETCRLVGGKPANKDAENQQTRLQETNKQACSKPASLAVGNQQTITEITQETTSEITAETTSLALLPAVAPQKRAAKKDSEADRVRQDACREIWSAYSAAYLARYKAAPVRNAKVNRQVIDLWKRLGAVSAQVANYFVTINDAYLIRNCHDLGSLLSKAESYHTQWATNRQMNGTTARQLEATQANVNAAQEAASRIQAKGARNEFL